jgi:Ca2+-binding RTX toxin-like protein
LRLTRISALAVAATVVSLLCMSASASAASSPFGCRASANRIGLDGTTLVEPLIANAPTTPCANDTRGVSSTTAQGGSPLSADTGPAAVYTATNSSPSAAALASVDGATVPTSSGNVVVAGPAYAEASYSCVNGSVVPSGTSNLDSVDVNGSPQSVTPNQNDTIQLGGGSYMIANEKIQTGNSLTERLLDVHLADGGEIVVGEAEVTENSSQPCAGGSGGGGGGSGGGGSGGGGPITVCPSGSSYDVGVQSCVIYLPGGGLIEINQPFGGETGGTVMSLARARKLYGSDRACLYGSGPKYAIVATKSRAHIQGTFRAERILALGGHSVVKGGGGNDCIAGPGGNDTLRDSNGNARVYGGPGHNQVFISNGNDRVWLGSGKNKLSAGRGNDWLYGGKGFDVFYVDNGPKHVFAGTRGGRVYAPGARDAVACRSHRDHVYVNEFALRYAQHHGCVAVRKLIPAQL